MKNYEPDINKERFSFEKGYLKSEELGEFNLINETPKRGVRALNQREKDIITLIGYGFSSIEIGKKMFISERTVEGRVRLLMAEFNAQNRAQLIWIILRNDLLNVSVEIETRFIKNVPL